MKHYLTIITICCFLISCSSPKKGNVTINGTVKGLKKGTLYLQRIQDTILVNIDSVVIAGDPNFIMSTELKEPEVLYLYLDKEDGAQYNDRLNFFAEPGDITIETTLTGFEKDVMIIGGKNEIKLQEFKKMNQRFNDRNLRLIKENFEASKQNDQDKLMENDVAYKKLLKQKYLYTINFAVTNRKLEVSPYITLNEIFDANIKFLDTIANSMSPRVRKSMYGKQLIQYIKDRKAKEAYNEIAN
ncbi:DUF4369 domain-containing protein [Aquimarina sp. W85]|uniref:DUF4369 domain-containing protein n=1 Tax=Aquimarina rhodophyticola TaxID=3342246 RepID=UPI003673385F